VKKIIVELNQLLFSTLVVLHVSCLYFTFQVFATYEVVAGGCMF